MKSFLAKLNQFQRHILCDQCFKNGEKEAEMNRCDTLRRKSGISPNQSSNAFKGFKFKNPNESTRMTPNGVVQINYTSQ